MELVYEDEILPEIEIRELLTLEQILDDNPSFVAFTRREIEDKLYDLTKDDATATSLTNEIYRIVSADKDDFSRSHVVPILKADKKRYDLLGLVGLLEEGGEDDDPEQQYFRALEDIKNAPNYRAQQSLLNKLTYPLDHRPPIEGERAFLPNGMSRLVGISSSLNMSTVLLPTDDAPEALAGAAFLPTNVTSESFLFERVESLSGRPPLATATFQNTTDLTVVRPTFESVLRMVKPSSLDLHTLRHTLLQYGYNMDTLTTPQLSALIEHLRALEHDEDDNDEEASAATAPTESWRRNWGDFFDALKQLPTRGLDKEKYNTIYNAIAASTPPIQSSTAVSIPMDHGRILEGIRANTFTIDEVATFLKMIRNKIIIDHAFATIQRYMEIDPEAIPEKIDDIIKKWMRRSVPYDDRTASSFLELYRDISEIKKGTDTSMYDGNPNEQLQVFEELRYAEPAVMEVEETEDDVNTDDLFGTDFDMSPFLELTEGVREVVLPVVRKLHTLSLSSGVPLSIPNLLKYIAPRIVRVSFAEAIKQNVPELAPNICLQLSTGNFESAMRVASSIVPLGLGERVQEVVRLLYKDYAQILASTFLESFAWFVIETQTAALEKRLEFEPRYGMMSCMKLWGPYGAPLTKEKQEVGVLYYLACVAHECGLLTDFNMKYEDFAKEVLSFTANTMTDKILELQEKYAEMLKEAVYTVSRAQQAKISLDYAIKEKSKQRLITEFVRSFLYLPGVSKTPRYMQLGPTFTSESDWQDMTKLKMVKDQLAKKRMTKIKRPELAWIESKDDVVTKTGPEFELPPDMTQKSDATRSRGVKTWLQECANANLFLLPPDVVNALSTDPTTLHTQITKNLSAFAKTVGRTSKLELTGGYPKLLDVVATSIYTSSVDVAVEDVEHQYIQMSMDAIRKFKDMWSHMDRSMVLDTVDNAIVSTMWRYVISRAACLPCDSRDANGRTGKLSIGDNVRVNFVQRILTKTMGALTSALNNAKMPTTEEQQAFITKMREIQKVQTLQVLNSQSEDERQMTLDAKKLGLYKTTIDYSQINAAESEADAEMEAEGEAEFAHEGEDPDYDDEQL